MLRNHSKKKVTLETKIRESLVHFVDKRIKSEWTEDDHKRARDVELWGTQAAGIIERTIKHLEHVDPHAVVLDQLKSLLNTGRARPRWWH